MIEKIHQILKDHWGYDKFRYLQKEIIISVLTKNDTLALLPTGGGKSICFQVPALYNEGVCLVITPLIALMKDQVENLNRRGIKASAIYSGMTFNEIDRTLDNAIYGHYKFLYVSPERLETEIFLERASKLNVNLIAVDEAHCISQWGYDFRPSYLNIAEIRKLYPTIPILALTATATEEVKSDIQKKLKFTNPQVFQKSFNRDNLIYAVVKEEAKRNKLVEILKKTSGTSIVYVRTRRSAREISEFLKQQTISADHYHAGLSHQERSIKQEQWKKGETRVIVSTNAFGMGIDKENVRSVIHMDLPDSLEAYYQEAGRAGRDLKKAYAIAIINEHDRTELEKRLETSFPSIQDIKKTYHALGNYFQIAIGSGKMQEFEFDFYDFINKFNLNSLITYSAIKELQKSKYISVSDEPNLPSRLIFLLSYNDLYAYQLDTPKMEPLIKTLLRSYSGLFENYVRIDESKLAKRLNTETQNIVNYINFMKQNGIIDYLPQSNKPRLTFLTERIDNVDLSISMSDFNQRKNNYEKKIRSVLAYAYQENKCRSKTLLSYFGEIFDKNCGHCDYCLNEKERDISTKEFNQIYENILDLLAQSDRRLDEMIDLLHEYDKKKIQTALKWLIDNNKIKISKGNFLSTPE